MPQPESNIGRFAALGGAHRNNVSRFLCRAANHHIRSSILRASRTRSAPRAIFFRVRTGTANPAAGLNTALTTGCFVGRRSARRSRRLSTTAVRLLYTRPGRPTGRQRAVRSCLWRSRPSIDRVLSPARDVACRVGIRGGKLARDITEIEIAIERSETKAELIAGLPEVAA